MLLNKSDSDMTLAVMQLAFRCAAAATMLHNNEISQIQFTSGDPEIVLLIHVKSILSHKVCQL